MEKNSFDQRLKKATKEIWSTIAQIDELKGQWAFGAKLNPQTLMRLKKSVLITSTGASTRIEGSRLTDEDVEKLMEGLSMSKFADRDKQEVRGYFELLKNIFNSWGKLSLQEGQIKHFHKELLKYVEKDKLHRGDYKTSENTVHIVDAQGKSLGVIFQTTPAYLTPLHTRELIEWTQNELKEKSNHPLLVIGNFIIEFLRIHPFQDGNGRISRILTNLLLLKSGYEYMPYVSHEKIVEENKTDYYLALRKSQKTFNSKQETITPWLLFFLRTILQQSQMAIELLSDENIERTLSQNQLSAWQYLQKVKDASPQEIAQNSNIARSTVNQVMNKLIRLKKVERIAEGRSTRYRVLNNL